MTLLRPWHSVALSCFSLLFLGSCWHPSPKKAAPAAPSWSAKDIEARLYDVPFFVHAQVSNESVQEDGSHQGGIVTLVVEVPLEQIYAFYIKEMEWFGWEYRSSIAHEKEALLSFEKPHKFCIISLHAITSSKTRVVIGTEVKNSDK